MQDNTVEYYAAPSYGRERFYPVNLNAERLLTLMRKKSFDPSDLILIKALGFILVEKPKPEKNNGAISTGNS